MFRFLLVTSILLLAAPPIAADRAVEYGEIKNAPWELDHNRLINQDHLTMGTCEANSEGAIICFEFYWSEGKLGLYAIMPFPPGHEGKFAEWKVPQLRVDQIYDSSVNDILERDRWIGYPGFPQINRGNIIAWRNQIARPDIMRNNRLGLFSNLSKKPAFL